MQKKSLIPTQLLTQREKRKMVIAPVEAAVRSGFYFYTSHLFRLLWEMFKLKVSGNWNGKAIGLVTSRFFERMGGIWVKAGQFFAMRRDLFSHEFCTQLANLHDHATGYPFKFVRQTIEEELGPIEHFFKEFDEIPLAAASIGQVHRAVLRRGGTTVAVKVQRPTVRESFMRDLRLIEGLCRLMLRFNVMPHAKWDSMLWEIRDTLREELDYLHEGFAVRRMRKVLKRHNIYVPKIYRELSTKRILCMEYVSGVFMSDFIKMETSDPERVSKWCEENKVKPSKVGKTLYFSHLRQIFEENLFHSDLHPGNILLLRKSRVLLIDFGAVGRLEATFRKRYLMTQTAMATGDYRKFSEMFLLLSPELPAGADTIAVRDEIARVVGSWEVRVGIKKLPYHEKSMGNLNGVIAGILMEHKIGLNWSFLRTDRALNTLDASLMFLLPEMNYIKLGKEYKKKAEKRMRKKHNASKVVKDLGEMLYNLKDIGENGGEVLMFHAETMRQKAANIAAMSSKASYVMGQVFQLFGVAAVLSVFLAVYVMCVQLGWLHGYPPWLTQYQLGSWLHDLPVLDGVSWFVLFAMDFLAVYMFFRIRAYFAMRRIS